MKFCPTVNDNHNCYVQLIYIYNCNIHILDEAGSKRCVMNDKTLGTNPSFVNLEDDYPPSKKGINYYK